MGKRARRAGWGLVAVLLAGAVAWAQTADAVGQQNAAKARAALNAMVKALGGDAWLHLQNEMQEGKLAAFFHGQPDPGTTKYWAFHAWPDRDRMEYTKHRDVVQFYLGRKGWEVTYQGTRPLPQEQVGDFLRRRDHSVETAVKVWMNEAKTILVYDGQRMAERHLADEVTLISPENESVTIQMGAQTHLPLRRIFEWRDPVYHDKNTDVEEYDGYHVVQGIATPFTITRFKNDEMVRQEYVVRVQYNQELGAEFWDVDATRQKIKKK